MTSMHEIVTGLLGWMLHCGMHDKVCLLPECKHLDSCTKDILVIY